MNCLLCRLIILDELADAASDLLDGAWPLEECLNPGTFEVDGDDYRKLDHILAKLLELEGFQ